MITEVSIYIQSDQNPEEEQVKDLVANVCDVLVAHGLGTETQNEATSVVVTKFFDVEEWSVETFLEGIMQDAVLAVIPVNPKESREDD